MATMAEPRWLNAEEQQAWRAFLAATRLLFDALDRELQHDAGIPHTYYEILVQLSESPDRTMRMSDLAARSLSSRSRLSHAVARLEEAGWVRRETCPTDKRGQLAVLITWSDAADDVIGGDLTAALAYITAAGGAVVTAVAPVGQRDRGAGTVGFTTSLGFGKKLERIVREPRIALAYHAREHGHA